MADEDIEKLLSSLDTSNIDTNDEGKKQVVIWLIRIVEHQNFTKNQKIIWNVKSIQRFKFEFGN